MLKVDPSEWLVHCSGQQDGQTHCFVNVTQIRTVEIRKTLCLHSNLYKQGWHEENYLI